ncbi:MAG: YbhN family protein [Candidatus Nanohaloarchaea archaeon]
MDSRTKRFLWFGVSTAIISSLVYLADLDKFLEALRTADLLLLAPAFFFGLAVFPAWAYTWYRVFSKAGIYMDYMKSLRIFMAGTFMNSITPIGQFGGEPVMAYLVSKNSDANYEKSISSVFSADIINGIPMVTFVLGGAIYLLIFGALKDVVLQAVYAAFLATAIGGILVYLLWFESGTIEGAILGAAEKFVNATGLFRDKLEGLEERLEDVEEAFRDIGEHPRYLFETAIVAHIGFLFQVGCLYFIMLSLGYNVDFTPIYFVVVISGLANFSPTPGGSGTFEAVMAGVANIFFPVTFAVGLIAAILFRLTTYWPGIIIGYAALNSLGNGDLM